MMSSQVSLVDQAKQGNTKAFTTLLNHKLQPKGITAKASAKNSCLHIMLEAANTPPQKPLVEFIQKVFSSFNIDAWHTVKVYGRQVGEDVPDWLEDFKIGLESAQSPEILAKQRNIKAIATLINNSLQNSGVIAKVSLKDDCLQIMLESSQVPVQKYMVSLIQTEVLKLDIQSVKKLSLYGKQYDDDFPDWYEEVLLTSNEQPFLEQIQTTVKLCLPPENNTKALPLLLVEKIDGVELSNQLYIAIQTICYQHLNHKVTSESNKSIHEIVEHFIYALESDLKLDIDNFVKEAVSITEQFSIQLELTKMQNIISDVAISNFTGVKLAIRELEKVTQEVLQIDFPQESDALKALFTGAVQEFTANLFGRTTMSTEAIVGVAIGTMIAPGIGSAIGGAIGGWLGGNKQQKAIQAIIEKYQKARANLFQEWETLLQKIYTKFEDSITSTTTIKILNYQVISKSIDFYNEANNHLNAEEAFQKAIALYDEAINLNPGLALAWNNKGYVLNKIGKYDEALIVLKEAIRLDSMLVLAFNNSGDALQALGRNEEAITAYNNSIQIDRENYAAWWGKGSCLYNLKQHREALDVCNRLIAIDSENFLGWYAKASCHALLEDTLQALENLKEAVRLDPDASQNSARDNPDFNYLREDERFKSLMESSVGVNYANLKKYLKEKQWCEADQETASLIRIVIQKVTNSTDINPHTLTIFPIVDLNTIDRLWLESSNGRFGFSVQKEIYQQSSKDRDVFGNITGWRVRDANGNYSWRSNSSFDYNFATASRGHLPSGLWAGEDGWFENRRDRLIALFTRINE